MTKLRVVGDQDIGDQVGICQHDLDDLHAKEGDWVGIKYDNNGKLEKTSAKIKRVDPEKNWKPNLIIIYEARKKLKLPDEISRSTPEDPSDYEVEVWKHTWPRDLKFYGAILTAIITILAASFGAYSESLPETDPLKFTFGLAALIVVWIGAILACVSSLLQKQ